MFAFNYSSYLISLQLHYVGVLLGANRLPGLEGPFEQTRRVVSVNFIQKYQAALVRMDKPVQLSRQVLPLTLPERFAHYLL
jgi:hypothetical protein